MLIPKVVLVEDNTTIRETLVPALQELAGARVVAMADGAQEALATLRQVPWDVLVLDMFLREGTGLEVLAQLPGELAGRKVYVLTNYATADLREACVRLGADAVAVDPPHTAPRSCSPGAVRPCWCTWTRERPTPRWGCTTCSARACPSC